MIAVVDYGRGNLFSLSQALRHIGADFEVTSDPERVARATKVILPGVGAFGDCINNLRSRGLDRPIGAAALSNVPLLGICVGCQILLETGEEFGLQNGLGLIPGTVRRLPESGSQNDAVRIPNVGWRSLVTTENDALFSDMEGGTMMYFVHSFAPVPTQVEHVSAWIEINGIRAAVAVRNGSIRGVQFHPEKSGPAGLALLRRFVNVVQ
jgi:imidazole glycerol-phosphate synthase subunit HisH